MLVLSRKKNQTVRFPNLGISVEILRLTGNSVRIGIDAPPHVRVLRGELGDDAQAADDPASQQGKTLRHELRNRLNSATLALHVLQKQLDAGRIEDAEATLTKALESFAQLDRLASEQALGATVSPGEAASKSMAGRRHALVVEDSANERELLAGYLRLCGYTVDAVEDGQAALDYLAKHSRPDVVLLDMQMPRLDGAKTIAAIRSDERYRDIKLFAVSGADRQAMELAAGDRGVDRWFQKPIEPGSFARALATELGSRVALCN